MTKQTAKTGSGPVSFAFNAGQLTADTGTQKPWRRAALLQRAEDEFRRLHGLRPARMD